MITFPVGGVDLNAMAGAVRERRSHESKGVVCAIDSIVRTFVSNAMAEELSS